MFSPTTPFTASTLMDYSPSVNLRVSHAILFLLSPTYAIFFLEGSEVLGQPNLGLVTLAFVQRSVRVPRLHI
jgi:hypothetical protein